ncbi:saccharopine dehydrogenase family protein [Reticulibacter mediterranei]|nr:saccharopine dehydrogenase NADP-binding domain-containing protein [Reticulibacter mediterranei]
MEQIVVYGATGYTGRQVVQELRRRGYTPILAGRDERALVTMAAEIGKEALVRVAQVDHPQSLYALVADSAAIINCAGPFGLTAEPLVAAAITAGVHYIDISAAEQRTIQTLLERFDASARQAGVVVLPTMGFYGALGDMLAHLVGSSLAPLDDLTIAYAVDGWLFNPSGWRTLERIGKERLVYRDGSVIPRTGPSQFSSFSFPAPIGTIPVMEGYPLGETVTLPRHLPTRQINALMATSTIDAITTQPKAATSQERAQSSFTIAVHAVAGQQKRYGFARGVDIFGITAPIAVEAALRLIAHGFSRAGALAPSEAFEPASFLNTLQGWDFSYETSVHPDTLFS